MRGKFLIKLGEIPPGGIFTPNFLLMKLAPGHWCYSATARGRSDAPISLIQEHCLIFGVLTAGPY